MRSLCRYLADVKPWDRPRIKVTLYCDYDAHPRTWKAANKATSWLHASGISEGGHSHFTPETQRRSCGFHIGLAPRPYIAFWPVWKWRCLLRFHHWPGEEVMAQTCGKCLPWPCCDATTRAHANGCKQEGEL